tara:strand:+ start:19616 stop:24925 length:5310 start_codon:yes stop_codon:yes gene_type:complete
MGNLNGPWVLVWIGDTNGCDEYDTIDLESKINIVFQTSQSGSAYSVQQTNSADSPFATIKKLNCGSGVVMQLKENTNLNHVIQSGSSSTARLIPNFPLEIKIVGLTSNYEEGNGTYLITTSFKNNFPTYKNTNGWTIEKVESGWIILHEIDNLNFLKNNSISPKVGNYKEINCNTNNCQTASTMTDEESEDDDAENDDSNLNDLPAISNLRTTELKTTSFSISWDGVTNISNYEIEISDTINFTESVSYSVNKNQQFFKFDNLTDGFSYYYRIRYKKYYGITDGVYSIRNVTTPISGKRSNLEVNLNEEFFPLLTWDLPTNVKSDYSIIIKRSKDKQNWDDLVTLDGKSNTVSYVDKNIGDLEIYYYAIVFYNGTNGDYSDIKVISVDKEKPRKPDVVSSKSPTLNKNLHFKWDHDNNISHYMYRFNESDWVKLFKNTTSVTITGKEGTNKFTLKSVDNYSNESDESVTDIIVDTTPPSEPVIVDIGSRTNKRNLTFSWSCKSDDVKEFLYRINKSSWIRIDKSLTSVSLKSIQGQNRFEIKAIDTTGNESEIAEYVILSDFKAPSAPSLSKTESPTKMPRLFFSWVSEEVNGFRYRITTWNGSNEDKIIGDWTHLPKTRRSITLNGIDGFYRFEIYSYDEFSNNSDISSKTILVDYTAPKSPELTEIDVVANTSTDQIKVRYIVELDSSAVGTRYRHNNTKWIDYDNESDSDLEIILDEGKNVIEMYSYDSVGNESDIRTIQKFIDSVAPSKPMVTSPIGGSPAGLMSNLWELVQKNSILENLETINIPFGYMNEGTSVNFENLKNGSRYNTASVLPLRTNTTTEFEFKKEIEAGFRSFKKIVEDLYDNIEINFIDFGEESTELKDIPAASFYGLSKEDFEKYEMPKIRIGMIDGSTDSTQNLKNLDHNSFELSHNIYFDKNLNWTPDSDVKSDSYSIQFGVRHFLGKIFGLPQNQENTHGTMHGIKKGLKIVNRESSDKNLFSKVYEFPTVNGNDIRVINSDTLEIEWKSDTDSYYEYRYAFISDTGRISSIERWRELDQQISKNGSKIIQLTDASKLNSMLRFYVRSFDDSNNTSDESYVDFYLPVEDINTNIEIISMNEKCENNSQYKNNSNCWDKFGLFSVELRVTENNLDSKYIVVEIKEASKNYARYEKIETINNGRFSIDSLKSNTDYTFRVCLVKQGITLSSTNTIYDNKVGEFSGKFSGFSNFKTPVSYTEKPSTPTIRQINHYRFKNNENSKFIYPLGESYRLNVWKPTCVIYWNKSNTNFFKNYEIQYMESDAKQTDIKSIIIRDQNQTEHNVRLDVHNKKYKMRLVLNDTLGNSVSSSWENYVTVPLDLPPELIEDFEVYYSGEINSIYNERPDSKWTLAFKIPKSIDKQFPQIHKVPDVEDFVRKDYKLIDWVSSIGHPPMRLEYNSSSSDSESTKSYWITHSKVYDDEFEETNLRVVKENNNNLIKISGFEEEFKYDFKFTVYDTSGHYIQKTRTIQTKPRTAESEDINVRPSIFVKKYRYINGMDSRGTSLKNIQWIIDVIVNIKTESKLKYFYVYYKTNLNSSYTKRFEVDITKIPDDRIWSRTGTNTYTLRLSGFQPKTRYYIKVDAVNDFGNLSESSNEFTYITPVGDIGNPEMVKLKSIKRTKVETDAQLQIGLMKSTEPNLDFALLHIIHDTKNNIPNNKWEFPKKNFISSRRINSYMVNGSYVLNIRVSSDMSKYHTIVMMWRDSAFNYSTPYVKVFEPETNPKISYLSDDDMTDNNQQQDNVLVLT